MWSPKKSAFCGVAQPLSEAPSTTPHEGGLGRKAAWGRGVEVILVCPQFCGSRHMQTLHLTPGLLNAQYQYTDGALNNASKT